MWGIEYIHLSLHLAKLSKVNKKHVIVFFFFFKETLGKMTIQERNEQHFGKKANEIVEVELANWES